MAVEKYVLKGETVRRVAARNHLTLGMMAVKLGVSRCYLSQLVNGRRALTPTMRRLLLQAPCLGGIAESDLWEVIDVEGERS